MLDVIKPTILNKHGISSWFTLRNQNVVHSDRSIAGLNLGFNTLEDPDIIQKNRDLLFGNLELEPEMIAFAHQVHKSDVKTVQSGGLYTQTDAFVTNTLGMILAIQVADCAAILLGDSENKVIGAAHAGWRGAVAGIVPNTVAEMIKLGANTDNIKAYISPCISISQFEVGEEVAMQFPDKFVDRISFKKPHVDLRSYIFEQLQKQGILEDHIQIEEGCTLSEERFYSYRRQKEKSGRMFGIIKLHK